jgi:hypothetical protein
MISPLDLAATRGAAELRHDFDRRQQLVAVPPEDRLSAAGPRHTCRSSA